jgi:hypothetical protein
MHTSASHGFGGRMLHSSSCFPKFAPWLMISTIVKAAWVLGSTLESGDICDREVGRCGREIALARVKAYTDDVVDGIKHTRSVSNSC